MEGESPHACIVIQEPVLVAIDIGWADNGGSGERLLHHLLPICLQRPESEGGRGGGGRDEDTSQELPCPHLGLQEAGGGGGVGIQGREVDESLDSGHTTSLRYHPRPIHMHLVVLEVSGEKRHLSASQPASQPAGRRKGEVERMRGCAPCLVVPPN